MGEALPVLDEEELEPDVEEEDGALGAEGTGTLSWTVASATT